MPINQVFIFLLAYIASVVAYGLLKHKNMWFWIVLYWMVLTAKNMVDLMNANGVI